MKRYFPHFRPLLSLLFIITVSHAQNRAQGTIDNSPGYDIAAFYFPDYHNNDPRNEDRYGTGWSEWELVKNAVPRFEGHKQPKIPDWGYTNESDPAVMEMKINAAAEYGVDVFIYDWYYYNDGPFLEKGLDSGYLKARNNSKVKFALMWANHDWVDIFPRNPLIPQAPLIYPGSVTPETFDKMTDYIVSHYFSNPSYWKIDGCPFFSIYELYNFVKGIGGKEQARAALEKFRQKTKKAGFRDLYLNAINWGIQVPDGNAYFKNSQDLLDYLSVNSTTSYVWVQHVPINEFPVVDYNKVENEYFRYCDQFEQDIDQPYYPNVTVGWDASPRCSRETDFKYRGYPFMAVMTGNTPENFGKALSMAKERVDKSGNKPKIITINSWNEWTEGSYLEPEREYGYGYLDEIKKVFGK